MASVSLHTKIGIRRYPKLLLVEHKHFVNNIKNVSNKIEIKIKTTAIMLSCIHFVNFAYTITIVMLQFFVHSFSFQGTIFSSSSTLPTI